MSNVFRPLVTVLGLAMLVNSMGCAFGEIYWDDPLKREYTLGEIQKRYTDLVRFGNYKQAVKYVDPELADEFLDTFPHQKAFVFTDYESGPIRFEDKATRDKATVRVHYSAYFSASLVVVDIEETQEWFREGRMNVWFVRPNFDQLKKMTSKST